MATYNFAYFHSTSQSKSRNFVGQHWRWSPSSSSSYCLQYALHMRSIIYCFGGVCAAASTILVVAIALEPVVAIALEPLVEFIRNYPIVISVNIE